jgi:hypothetical protein
MFSRAFFPGVFLCFAAGCSSGWGNIMALRQYSAGQNEITRYVKRTESRFAVLVADIKNNNIKTGLKYNEVLSRYGEPVITWDMAAPSLASKKLLYRKPVNYFSTDRVYLYFNNYNNLVKWEYCPALKEDKESTDVKKSN